MKRKLKDDDQLKVAGGLFCNITGFCSKYQCKHCGKKGENIFARYELGIRCLHDRDCKYSGKSNCKTCINYQGGVICKI